MRVITAFAIVAISTVSVGAQEAKKVPKDSMRVTVPGCTKGYVFTAGPKKEDQVARNGVPGLMKKGQYAGTGINIGGGVHVGPTGPPVAGSGIGIRPGAVDEGVNYIDVESWRPIAGDCPL
jgi:hypothetical protein